MIINRDAPSEVIEKAVKEIAFSIEIPLNPAKNRAIES